MVYSPVLGLRHTLRRFAAPLLRSPVVPTRRMLSASVKPDFTKETNEKYFDFNRLEPEIYKWWETKGMFKPEVTSAAASQTRKPFVIPMPPPNVTGYLHMGHAIFVALQDIMARFHRMRGRPTLWLPGTDHAGIATQLLVERQLQAEGFSRTELGREAFLERVWKWKAEKGGYITGQMKRLGASADWSREKFTLQEDMSSSVTEAFIRLHERGLIYRGNYMVNWSPHLQTAVSDLEVDYSEEQGTLYYFKYVLSGPRSGAEEQQEGVDFFIPVATTRPETILGDTAVCVHPEDPRYKHFIGRTVKVPMSDRLIPVIADEFVDREFGTGALKVTPAHDLNDYELGKKHGLPLISVMNRDASINSLGGARYAGLTREQCRDRIWEDIQQAGLALTEINSSGTGTQPHLQRVPRSQRGGEVIEPMVSPQWFVRADGMAENAVKAVRQGDIAILPERYEKVWYNWLENIHDWCISRQLWWGHRIPVYYVNAPAAAPAQATSSAGSAAAAVAKDADSRPYVVARSLEEAQRMAVEQYGAGVTVTQDEDVLDTWFSSGLWPFATVGWPQQENECGGGGVEGGSKELSDDFQRYYPATVLETGYDILFFWVARMVMLGLELTGRVPFQTVYLHGLVRDATGQKMSKTKGNVLDPVDVVDRLGADALRYSLVTGSTPGNDVPLAIEKIETNRNFANKLWNAGKFISNCLAGQDDAQLASLAVQGPMTQVELMALAVPERYIVSRCHEVTARVTACLESYSFADAGRLVHDFLWDELADWYIEASKVRMRGTGAGAGGGSAGEGDQAQADARRVLVYVWDTCMRLLHPFMPYLTETLWQQIPHRGDSIMIAAWPQLQQLAIEHDHQLQELGQGQLEDVEAVMTTDSAAVKDFGSLQALVRSIRNARAEYNVDAGKKIPVILKVHGRPALHALFEQERQILSLLARAEDSQLVIVFVEGGDSEAALPEVEAAGPCVHLVVEEGLEAFLPQSGLVDPRKERLRLSKQAEKLQKDIGVFQARLQSAGFVDRAPPHLVTEAKDKIRDMEEQLRVIDTSLLALG